MRAMVLAAGLGTRLLPLTRLRPKCLMPVYNQPLLAIWLHHLAGAGASRVVVNTHHLASMVRDELPRLAPPGLEVLESHEPEILGTGGALVAAARKLGRAPFLLANSDVLCSADPTPLIKYLQETGAVACLGLVDWPEVNTVALGPEGRVRGFYGDIMAAPEQWLTYSGIAAISPELLNYLPGSGFSSLVDGLRGAIKDGRLVAGLELDGYWDDLGTPERYLAGHRDMLLSPPGLEDLAAAGPIAVHPTASVHPDAVLQGFCSVGPGVKIGAGAHVSASVLLSGSSVAEGAVVSNTVLGDGFKASGEVRGGAHA